LDLGAREQQLLQLLLSGYTIRAAAGQLHVSSRTTEAMLAELRGRVDAPSLYALGAIAERLGWHESETVG
jgi:DNA-binding NarL/FixJ family response regulator